MLLDIRKELVYFRKKREEIFVNPDSIVPLREQSPWLEMMQALHEQLTKQTRLAFKNNQENSGKLDAILQELKELYVRGEEQIQVQQKMNEWEWRFIGVIDQLDHAVSFFQDEKNEKWIGFFDQLIAQLLRDMKTLRIEEIPLIGRSFDPLVCEALGTMKKVAGEYYVPYQVGRVIRRGFEKNGVLLRKALVLTFEEGDETGE